MHLTLRGRNYKDAAITLCSTSQRFCQKNELKRQHTDGQTNLNLKTPFRKTDSRYPATPWVGDISLFVSSLAEPTLRSLDKHRTQTLAVEKIKKESLSLALGVILLALSREAEGGS